MGSEAGGENCAIIQPDKDRYANQRLPIAKPAQHLRDGCWPELEPIAVGAIMQPAIRAG